MVLQIISCADVMKTYASFSLSFCIYIVIVSLTTSALAQALPGSTDAGRIGLEQKKQLPSPPQQEAPTPSIPIPLIKAPESAQKIRFILKDIRFEGVTAFKAQEMEPLYQHYLGKEISLDIVWQITDQLAKLYQDNGYFLSRTFVPAQAIDETGIITIKAVEGYVGVVEIDDSVSRNYVVKNMINQLTMEKPLKIKTLESFMLRLNDLHVGAFRSVVEPLNDTDKNDAAVKLLLVNEKKQLSGSIRFDNYNSMFSGPYQATAALKGDPINLHQTSVTFLNSLPLDKLHSISVNHNIALTPKLSADFDAGYTDSHPGYTLKPSDVESDSSNMSLSLNFQPIRQRRTNLIFKVKLDSKDVATNVLHTALTRDHIRVARVNVTYDRSDPLNGYNFLNATWSHGLTAFDASERTDQNLSRTGVDPKFKKMELNWNRFQNVGSWTGVTSMSMQFAKGPQYSSEQIGYGGQSYGRAYDPSEIVGDQGMLASFELRYDNLPAWKNIHLAPYGFYDIGKVWSVNDDTEGRNSIGLGIKANAKSGLFTNFTVAQPLMHKITTPPYGNGKNPRLLLQVGYEF